jgi:hypothetical protein
MAGLLRDELPCRDEYCCLILEAVGAKAACLPLGLAGERCAAFSDFSFATDPKTFRRFYCWLQLSNPASETAVLRFARRPVYLLQGFPGRRMEPERQI